jgi:hypothetical protein
LVEKFENGPFLADLQNTHLTETALSLQTQLEELAIFQ